MEFLFSRFWQPKGNRGISFLHNHRDKGTWDIFFRIDAPVQDTCIPDWGFAPSNFRCILLPAYHPA
jgi:hypothetical protein